MGVRKLITFQFFCDFCNAAGPVYHDREDFGGAYPREVAPRWSVVRDDRPSNRRTPYNLCYACPDCSEKLPEGVVVIETGK